MSGVPFTTNPPFGYMKNPDNTKEWVVDEEAAKTVRQIFALCVEGLGPTQIAKRLKAAKVLTPTEYWISIGRNCSKPPAVPYNWCAATVADILSKQEYCGDTVNFRSTTKSFKNKTKIERLQEEWKIFPNTHPAIIDREEFELVQELRQHRRRPTKSGIVSWFSGLLYCADCGEKLYYSVTNNYKREQAYFFCSSFRKNSDERYATLSMSYEEEQRELKTALPDMENYLETETDKTENLQRFIDKVKRITEIKELTAELVHEFIDKIVVHAPRHLDGKRVQLIDIYYNGVGILRELTPEEMEEAFQNHTAERKAKTA